MNNTTLNNTTLNNTTFTNTSTDTSTNTGSAPEGIEPEELPLFREFEAFVSAIYVEATQATSQELHAAVALLSQTILEKHAQHTRIADEVAAKLPRIAEEFTRMAEKHSEVQQTTAAATARALQQSAKHFNDTIQSDLAKLPIIAEEFTRMAAKHNEVQQTTAAATARALQDSAKRFNETINSDLAAKTAQIGAAVDHSTARLSVAVDHSTARLSVAVDHSAARLGSEVEHLANTVASSRESYFHLFEPFAEDLYQRNRILLDEHLRHLRALQDNLALWPGELASHSEKLEQHVRQEISGARAEVAAAAGYSESVARLQQEQAAGSRRSLTIVLTVCVATLLVSAGTLLGLILHHL